MVGPACGELTAGHDARVRDAAALDAWILRQSFAEIDRVRRLPLLKLGRGDDDLVVLCREPAAQMRRC